MDNHHSDQTDNVQQRTDEFIEALLATPALSRFQVAAQQFESDPEVQSLIETLQRFQQARQAGLDISENLQEVRDAQTRIRNHPVVQEFLSARQELSELIQATNAAISEPIGLNFGQAVGPASG